MMELLEKSSPGEEDVIQSEVISMPLGGGEGPSQETAGTPGTRKHTLEIEGTVRENIDTTSELEQLSASRWSSLTRMFRLDSEGPSDPDRPVTASHEVLTSAQRRGSLGKLFRQGFVRPATSGGNRPSLDPALDPKLRSTTRSKMDNFLKVFKTGKSQEKEPSSTESSKAATRTAFSRNLSRLGWKKKTKLEEEMEKIEKLEKASMQDSALPSRQMRGRSLGRFFKLNQGLQTNQMSSETLEGKKNSEEKKNCTTTNDKVTDTEDLM